MPIRPEHKARSFGFCLFFFFFFFHCLALFPSLFCFVKALVDIARDVLLPVSYTTNPAFEIPLDFTLGRIGLVA